MLYTSNIEYIFDIDVEQFFYAAGISDLVIEVCLPCYMLENSNLSKLKMHQFWPIVYTVLTRMVSKEVAD